MNDEEIQGLINDWLNDSLAATEKATLESWLAEHPDHMRQFVEANVRDQILGEVAKTKWDTEETCLRTASKQNHRRRIPKAIVWAAAVAATLLIGIQFFTSNSSGGATAQIVSLSGVRIGGYENPPRVGDELQLTDFQLETGSLTMMLASGVRLEFVAPVDATFESDMRLKLVEGCLSANVGDDGTGFTVVTNAGEVVDLGTEFGIEADRDGESRVAVFSGSVEFHPNAGSQSTEFITLTEGEALRFSARGGFERWQQISLAADRAGLTGKPSTGVVREVHDNLRDGELRRFYGVVRGGMKPGALAFTDKENPVWSAMPGQEFPSWLEGADLIRTYYRVSYFKQFELSVTLGGSADVFLMVAPNETPDWLEGQFQRTGVQLRTGPWHREVSGHPDALISGDGIYMTFDVWKRSASKGELKFGPPPNRKDEGIHSTMYGLAVKTNRAN
ncbi:FecR protein domain protein [Rhodopirellula maiorica SM1]|uniref:FecR protein domain protein n=1 Tax=Rhodopirellula maiorica SM1 TaxID=1265738 RepID=M5RR93_9BACT|nr:FecR family protein [Rhodopirellula maiorica]EMI21795.1 FecR protein domain protein [Rhodopirellula maiorica SM1]